MKKASAKEAEMKPEYSRADLGPLVRGKYAVRYAKATNVVVIDPALSKAFPNNEAVNNALRSLLTVATASVASKAVGRSGLVQAKRGAQQLLVGSGEIACLSTSPERNPLCHR